MVSDRIAEIRARLDAATPAALWRGVGWGDSDGALIDHAPDDIAWLLRELDRWMHVAKNDLYGMCWCDAPRPDCCECPGARGDVHRGEVIP